MFELPTPNYSRSDRDVIRSLETLWHAYLFNFLLGKVLGRLVSNAAKAPFSGHDQNPRALLIPAVSYDHRGPSRADGKIRGFLQTLFAAGPAYHAAKHAMRRPVRCV